MEKESTEDYKCSYKDMWYTYKLTPILIATLKLVILIRRYTRRMLNIAN